MHFVTFGSIYWTRHRWHERCHSHAFLQAAAKAYIESNSLMWIYNEIQKQNFIIFIFCWPCISVQFLLITNLTHLFNVFIYVTSLRVSSNPVLIIRRINCLSIHHLVCINLCRWLSGMPVRTSIPVTYTEWYILDDVLIQLILLMMSIGLLETCREVK
jgi:hypothetical protein